MALQYDAPSSRSDFPAALSANPTLSSGTSAAINQILGDAQNVSVGSFDGTNLQAGNPGGVDVVVASIAGKAGDKVTVNLPAEAMASASAWVFNSDADLSVRFNTVERVIASGNGNDQITVAGDKNTTLDGADGNDTLTTSGGDDSVTGAAGDDSVSTGAGNDTIVAGEGNDTIDAGTGFDVVQMTGASSDYTFDVVGGKVVAKHVSDTSLSVTVSNGEIFTFGGGDNVVVTEDATAANAMRMYGALFDRAPDAEGAEYWLELVDNGTLSLKQVADYFLESPEFKSKGELANDAYIELLYVNGLGRASDAEGKAFWVDAMEQGLDEGAVLIEFVGSAGAAEEITNVLIVTGQV